MQKSWTTIIRLIFINLLTYVAIVTWLVVTSFTLWLLLWLCDYYLICYFFFFKKLDFRKFNLSISFRILYSKCVKFVWRTLLTCTTIQHCFKWNLTYYFCQLGFLHFFPHAKSKASFLVSTSSLSPSNIPNQSFYISF